MATTHYKATIDLAKAADQAAPELREAVRASIEAMQKQTGTSQIPVEIWVGDDGYVHRMTMSLRSGQNAAKSFDMQMTMEMYDFGAPVNVEIPPASKVTDITDMVIQGGRAP